MPVVSDYDSQKSHDDYQLQQSHQRQQSHKKFTQTNHSNGLPVTVITTCYGRNRHLYNLLASLQAGTKQPAEIIIVNDDADRNQLQSYDLNIRQVAIASTEPSLRDQQDVEKEGRDECKENKNSIENKNAQDEAKISKHQVNKTTGFDIGRNRNLGAEQASYETLIFLDVDCIVATDFIEGITQKIMQHPQALIMGQPRYLTRPLNKDEAQRLAKANAGDNSNHNANGDTLSQLDSWLTSLSVLNPYRHNMVADTPPETHPEANPCIEQTDEQTIEQRIDETIEQTQDYGSFWSLCFAINRTQFQRIGGFDTDYVGYGAEDTDFAFSARQLDIDFYLTNDVVYHQQHSVYRPPINHLNSIVINANRFYKKWHHWPMSGWLAEFASMELIAWTDNQQNPIDLLRQPTEQEVTEAHCPDAPFV